jgi:pimeloyl-ACP methyl ester carboxylesterase
VALVAIWIAASPAAAAPRVMEVFSKDGTRLAVECAGSGPELLIVHGGTGDRSRWTPMFPYLQEHFTVCAMDRRAHGQSADAAGYSLRKEAEDIVAVVKSRGRPVAVLGHSYGGVVAYEAAFLTSRISKLVLYEPPLQDADHSAATAKMETLIKAGDREEATITFFREIVHVTPEELAGMRSRPSWNGLVGSIATAVRQDRALAAYRWDPVRARSLHTPTLLLLGSHTASPELRLAVEGLAENLPSQKLVVLEGQEHNAMDTDREHLAAVIKDFLLSAP